MRFKPVAFLLADFIRNKRQTVLDVAYLAHPERFVRGQPSRLPLPKEVWINKTKTQTTTLT